MATDAIKTIREALDGTRALYSERCRLAAEARIALDALEAELATLRECHAANVQELHRADVLIGELRDEVRDRDTLLKCPETEPCDAHKARLRARLAPADSPPGDEEMRKALDLVRRMRVVGHDAEPYGDWVCDAAEAHLRSQQPETEEQRQRTGWARIACAELNALAKARDAEGGKS